MAVDANATNAFKANPIAFLAAATLLPPVGNATRHNHSEHYGLAPTVVTAVAVGGAPIAIWQVVKAQPGEAYFRSYIADYEQGRTTFTTLGTNRHAEFCFTANMNGCTFGVGHQAQDGTLVVSHGNAANATGIKNYDTSLMMNPRTQATALQNALQYTRAKEGHGEGRVFEPSHYRIGQRMSVTFGHRPRAGNGQWQFYYISYTRGGGVVTSYGVNPMPTNIIT